MDAPLTMHLDWEDSRLADAKAAVEELISLPGWQHLVDLIEARADHLLDALVNEDPTDEGATYAAALAEIRAHRQFPALVEGLLIKGSEAQERARAEELEPVAA